MEIKSYTKHIPQPPVTPPPLEQKRITVDLTFEQYLLILASVGVSNGEDVQKYINDEAPAFKHVKAGTSHYSVYVALLKHAEAARIVSVR